VSVKRHSLGNSASIKIEVLRSWIALYFRIQ